MGIKEFSEKVKSDSSFAAKFKNAKTPAQIVDLAKAEGYSFTVDDVKAASNLSDKDLDAVAGGGSGGVNVILTNFIS